MFDKGAWQSPRVQVLVWGPHVSRLQGGMIILTLAPYCEEEGQVGRRASQTPRARYALSPLDLTFPLC